MNKLKLSPAGFGMINLLLDVGGKANLFLQVEDGTTVEVELTETDVRSLYYECGAILQSNDRGAA